MTDLIHLDLSDNQLGKLCLQIKHFQLHCVPLSNVLNGVQLEEILGVILYDIVV